MDFDAPDPVRFPEHASLAATEAILEPGDTLYIPPFWWHRIETLPARQGSGGDGESGGGGGGSGVALSLSVVSPSAEEATLAAAAWHPLPFLAFNATQEPAHLPALRAAALAGAGGRSGNLSAVVRSVAGQAYMVHLASSLGVAPGSLAAAARAAK